MEFTKHTVSNMTISPSVILQGNYIARKITLCIVGMGLELVYKQNIVK